MRRRYLRERLARVALPHLLLRGAVVGAGFLVMLMLARMLGLAVFGMLVHHWALALMATTVIGAGGPLLLLRAPSGPSQGGFWTVALLQPTALALIGCVLMPTVWPSVSWAEIFALAVAITFSQAAASSLRAGGSTVVSMILRDALPTLSLGAVAMFGADLSSTLLQTAGLLLAMSLVPLVLGQSTDRGGVRAPLDHEGQGSLWVSSMLGTMTAQIDLIVAGALLPADMFGLYALLRRVANLVALPVSVATWISAGPVADALRRHDIDALARASAVGSRIAWWPAMSLFGCGLIAVTLVPLWPSDGDRLIVSAAFSILLLGALAQAYWASGFTVANLSARPGIAVEARGLSVVIYAVLALVGGTQVGPVFHAFAYSLAISLGSLILWYRLRRRLGIDTSAAVLRRDAVVSS